MNPPSPIDSPLLSPAKARQAAIQAKDWAYVNSWLNRQYARKPVPDFERNEDTLRTLLALAAANDAADEEAMLLHRAREEAVRDFKAREDVEDKQKRELLDEVEMCLDEKGRRDLDDLADTAIVLGTLGTETGAIGQAIVELTKEEFDAKDQVAKIDTLQKYLEKELASLRGQLEELKVNKAYEMPANLPALTAEWSRSTKLLTAKVGEYQDKVASLERNRTKGPTIEELIVEEEKVVKLKETVTSLEAKVKMFHGLPKDLDDARSYYKQLQRELNQLIRKRDDMFGNLRD